jgi:hypothetical protein
VIIMQSCLIMPVWGCYLALMPDNVLDYGLIPAYMPDKQP